MDDDRRVLDLLDRRLDAALPRSAAPPDLGRHGAALRRRRARRRWAAGVAAAIVAIGSGSTATTLLASDPEQDDAAVDTALDPTTSPARYGLDPVVAPPRGKRWIGFDGVAIAVPTGWVDRPHCVRVDLSSGVAVQRGPEALPCGEDSAVVVFRLDSPVGRLLRDSPDTTSPTVLASGLRGRRGVACLPRARCPIAIGQYVLLPEQSVVVAGPPAERDAPLDPILASVRPLEAGEITVPAVTYGSSDTDAARALAESGLEARLPDVDFPHYVVGTDPPAGAVVAEGSTVDLVVGDG